MNNGTQFIIHASAHEIPLRSDLFHTCVTSPPYYSLRAYSGEQHLAWPSIGYRPIPGAPTIEVPPMISSLGLESRPEWYIGHLVECFRQVRRVLRDDGVLWIVIGDSYNAAGYSNHANTGGIKRASGGKQRHTNIDNLQPGDLLMIPQRLALALQADGWLVRNDVVWRKKSPMPESVSGWRWEKCRMKVSNDGNSKQSTNPAFGQSGCELPSRDTRGLSGAETVAIWAGCPGCKKCEATNGYVLHRGSWRHTRGHEYALMLTKRMGYFANQERAREADNDCAGNPRSVVTSSSEPFSGSHYAVYPKSLIAPLLLATAPSRVCAICGEPWAPVVEREIYHAQWGGPARKDHQFGLEQAQSPIRNGLAGCTSVKSNTVGYRPTCNCSNLSPVPGWVLDPFVGSGTTLSVCRELGVNAVGLDLSPGYLDEHAKPRIGQTPSGALGALPLFELLETE